MTKKKKQPNRVDELLDEVLEDHLKQENQDNDYSPKRNINRQNGYSQKTVQSELGKMELSIPRDRQSSFESTEHYLSDQWHRGLLEFDFRNTPTAFYSIFAPRINEGCSKKGSVEFIISEVYIYEV